MILLQTAKILSQISVSNSKENSSDHSAINSTFPPDKDLCNPNPERNINLPHSAAEINNGQNLNHIDDTEKDNVNKNPEISETLFILGENNGKLAVLSPDRETVYETFDVYINTLPEYDKNLLLDGIKIKTAEELHSLLEDYNS